MKGYLIYLVVVCAVVWLATRAAMQYVDQHASTATVLLEALA